VSGWIASHCTASIHKVIERAILKTQSAEELKKSNQAANKQMG